MFWVLIIGVCFVVLITGFFFFFFRVLIIGVCFWGINKWGVFCSIDNWGIFFGY